MESLRFFLRLKESCEPSSIDTGFARFLHAEWARSIVRIVHGPPEPMTWVQIPASPYTTDKHESQSSKEKDINFLFSDNPGYRSLKHIRHLASPGKF